MNRRSLAPRTRARATARRAPAPLTDSPAVFASLHDDVDDGKRVTRAHGHGECEFRATAAALRAGDSGSIRPERALALARGRHGVDFGQGGEASGESAVDGWRVVG